MDANGRLRLSAGLWRDFARVAAAEAVLFCLPEGGLGLYPPSTLKTMRRQDRGSPVAADNLAFRRRLRRFGALAVSVEVTRQGRITIPPAFREHAGIAPRSAVALVGVEIGVEIWNLERWRGELARIRQHMTDKGEQEMEADLRRAQHGEPDGKE